ncbi:nuclear transport factor 2 family protein [Aquimarina sp. 2304DJ70-9]|uniref:nuclear transport factor 2 family protein n=1 Tax=Aquimarina penaris TaxID=3231044 RepID=UPI0034630678
MHRLIVFTFLFSTCIVFSQKDNSKDVSRYEKEVKQTILQFFEGFHSGDTVKIKNTMDENITMQTIAETKNGGKKAVKTDVSRFLTAIQSRPAEQRWDERLLLFKIDADSTIANAWTPYEFYFNDTFSHCGVNVFQLYNDGTSWKIISIADTRNREGCK